MIHWKASRLLVQLPDDTLPPQTEIEVRVHVASCARCRTQLHEIQVSEDLLRRLPPSIVPLEPAYVPADRFPVDPKLTGDPPAGPSPSPQGLDCLYLRHLEHVRHSPSHLMGRILGDSSSWLVLK